MGGTSCHCQATADHFGPEAARKDLERYRKEGPDATTGALLDLLRSTNRRYARLLDVGAGIGVLHHELVPSLVDEAIHVEASSAYIEAATREDARRGNEDRVTYVHGDAADLVGDLAPADAVVLDRAICCYPEWKRLVAASAARTTHVYAFSIPRDRWSVRLGVTLNNLFHWIRADAFRAYVHPVSELERVLREMGFRRMLLRRTFVWHVALFALDAPAEASARA